MKQNTKDWIQYSSAIMLIMSAIVIVFISFLTIERIAEGVNTYVGIAISGALAIFGVAAYFVNQVAQFKTEIRANLRQEVREELKRQEHDRHCSTTAEDCAEG